MSNLVSVIMPVFNGAKTVGDSIRSVLEQTYGNLELIVIDDCSSDDTTTVLAAAAASDARVVVCTHVLNQGVAAARNTGIAIARGQYIALLDADDLWDKRKLELQTEFMDRRGLVFTYTDYSVFKVVDGAVVDLGKRVLPASLSYHDLLQRGHTVGALSVMLERGFLGDTRFTKRGHEDFALWLSLLRSQAVSAHKVPSDVCLAQYRVSDSSLSSSKLRAAKWMWSILRGQEGLGMVRGAYGFARYALRSSTRSV